MNLGCQVLVAIESREGEERQRRGGGGAVDLVGAVESCRQSRFILRSTWRTTTREEDRELVVASVRDFWDSTRSRDHVVVDSDRYDRDRGIARRALRQDGGVDERQDAVHQEPAGLPWHQERSLRGLHGAVLLCTYVCCYS